ncbi:MAG: cation-transporting P-type ATPase, partial [Deinococcus-Thermus bacterium]|nr:cation-transporting P-type ATPase [Deinococcota bacterium]
MRSASGSAILDVAPELSDPALLAAARDALAAALSGAVAPEPSDRRAAPARAFHAEGAERLLEEFASDGTDGLTDDEARARRHRDGPNRLPSDEGPSRLALFAEQFNSLPVAMLGVSSLFSLSTGGVADAVATLSVVGLNAVFGYVTEGQAEAAIHKLMDASGTTVTVRRGGRDLAVKSGDVVPGDVLIARPGTQVAADARLIACEGLMADESVLTGEAEPVRKDADARTEPDVPIGARPTMLHAGTLVTEGRGRALVVATGARTASAEIALLSGATERPRAPVEVELDALSGTLAKLSLAAC